MKNLNPSHPLFISSLLVSTLALVGCSSGSSNNAKSSNSPTPNKPTPASSVPPTPTPNQPSPASTVAPTPTPTPNQPNPSPAPASSPSSTTPSAPTTPTTPTTPSTPSSPSTPQTVQFNNSQTGEAINAVWYPPVYDGKPKAVVVALHGCGGLWSSSTTQPQKLSQRYREYVAQFQQQGFGVLLPDSFTLRNLTNVCQTTYDTRQLTTSERAGDATGALKWLASQPYIDMSHVGLVGWSNGATTSLRVRLQQAKATDPTQPNFASTAVFYPGCASIASKNASLGKAPLLIQIGADDDWTPAKDCEQLLSQRQLAGEPFELKIYPNSYHGFDSNDPVKVRLDVPNGVNGETAGVHQGGNPVTNAQAKAELDAFLRRTLIAN
ncbi:MULTISPECIES: dienelactone hydrolase family protein [unclassified Moraxella]|uniref:dienelactone hydrolase family protein n=1 Tax=unclassified Moraxella TaxID=2685852 RepID=UPI003AF57F5F